MSVELYEVGVKGNEVWVRFSVVSTVDQVAGGGALLFRKHCETRVKDTCGAV